MADGTQARSATSDDFPVLWPVATRWTDNDIYGHLNNTVYYSLMDTAINNWLIREGGLDIHGGDTIGVCVESRCVYKASAAFPEPIHVGLRVERLGRSSVTYRLGLFAEGGKLLAEGSFTHVFVDRANRRPTPIAGTVRESLERLSPGESPGSGEGR
ncbi:MAG: acyl-CoA thioesterase [Micromonosporaceae bacterium]